MPYISKRVISFGLLFLFFKPTTNAQITTSDSIFYQKAINNTITQYHIATGHQARIYNGSRYNGYPFLFAKGHPFFDSEKFVAGSIVYDNVFYPNLLIKFNEHEGTVILKDEANSIQLVTERIEQFTIGSNKFNKILKDSSNTAFIQEAGFYNLIYGGKTLVLKQEQKIIDEDISEASIGIQRNVKSINYFFIKKSGSYFLINKKKKLIEVFAENKKEINAFIKNEKLDFNADRQTTITKVVEYYDKFLNK